MKKNPISNYKLPITQRNSGQSLVEMLIAISIVVISLLGILVLINRSLGLNKATNEFYTATYLASEGIEVTKNLFDRSFLQTTNNKATRGSRNFYGWIGIDNIRPVGGLGIYQIDYKSRRLPNSICGAYFSGSDPIEAAVRKLIFSSCSSLDVLRFDARDGIYSYDPGKKATKFKRVIIIDKPAEFKDENFNLDYRVTSVVGWESRGGKFLVQLQDHFLPWRLP